MTILYNLREVYDDISSITISLEQFSMIIEKMRIVDSAYREKCLQLSRMERESKEREKRMKESEKDGIQVEETISLCREMTDKYYRETKESLQSEFETNARWLDTVNIYKNKISYLSSSLDEYTKMYNDIRIEYKILDTKYNNLTEQFNVCNSKYEQLDRYYSEVQDKYNKKTVEYNSLSYKYNKLCQTTATGSNFKQKADVPVENVGLDMLVDIKYDSRQVENVKEEDIKPMAIEVYDEKDIEREQDNPKMEEEKKEIDEVGKMDEEPPLVDPKNNKIKGKSSSRARKGNKTKENPKQEVQNKPSKASKNQKEKKSKEEEAVEIEDNEPSDLLSNNNREDTDLKRRRCPKHKIPKTGCDECDNFADMIKGETLQMGIEFIKKHK